MLRTRWSERPFPRYVAYSGHSDPIDRSPDQPFPAGKDRVGGLKLRRDEPRTATQLDGERLPLGGNNNFFRLVSCSRDPDPTPLKESGFIERLPSKVRELKTFYRSLIIIDLKP